MSGALQNLAWAFEQSGLSPIAKLVLIHIAASTGMSARWKFHIRSVGAFAGASDDEILNAVNELEASERLVIMSEDGDSIDCALPWVSEVEGGRSAPPRKLQYKAEIRGHLMAMQDWLCWYCGCSLSDAEDTPHVEHQIPLCRGGKDEIENLVMACAECNLQKGRMTVDEFRVAFFEEDAEIKRFYGETL